MRIAMGIEYDGTNYYGWQRQENVISIQEKVENAISKVADELVTVTCAGRTDAGVHALCQVIHFNTGASRADQSWILGANSNLPDDIRILWAKHVSDDFHARYSATARKYRYMVYNNNVASALLRNRAMWYYHALDANLMQEAGKYLLGEHDFSSFRGSGCQSKSAMRNVMSLGVGRSGGMVTIDITANAFLLHMVRNIAGMLLEIGSGKHTPIWAREILEARDRRASAATAEPQGLYLVNVSYND